jgi:hypothetical protein
MRGPEGTSRQVSHKHEKAWLWCITSRVACDCAKLPQRQYARFHVRMAEAEASFRTAFRNISDTHTDMQKRHSPKNKGSVSSLSLETLPKHRGHHRNGSVGCLCRVLSFDAAIPHSLWLLAREKADRYCTRAKILNPHWAKALEACRIRDA